MTIEREEVFINAGEALREGWPENWPAPPAEDLLDKLWLGSPELVRDEAQNIFTFDTRILVMEQVGFALPGLNEVAFVFGAADRNTVVPLHVEFRPDQFLSINDVPLAVRLPKDLLRPVRRAAPDDAGESPTWELDPTREFPDITIARASFEVNGDGDITFTTEGTVDLPPVMLGESGVVIEARNIAFHFDPNDPPPGQPVGFRGIFLAQATLALPGELGELVGELQIVDAYIGVGGFTGTFADSFTPAKQVSFFGADFELQRVEISVVQNAFTGALLAGRLAVPFFDLDEPLDVEISFTLNGDFSVRVADDTGIITLQKGGVFQLAVESIGFEVEDGLFQTVLSGRLTPTIRAGDLDWPTLEVRELVIDANGNVHLEGGWLNLREAYTLDFYGFQFEISRLGFGRNDDGSKWVGMNGALRLVDGIQAGASVEGLRLTWFDGGGASLSVDGVGVEFEIPEALRFKGFVAFREEGGVHRFDGEIELELLALDLLIDAKLVFGHANAPDGSYNFMGIFLGVELPAGIPLFTTGLGIYGMAGLFASNLAPDKAPDEEWYGLAPGEGWYKRPEVGVTDIINKWTNQRGALGLGLGVTIGTLSDNGYVFSGRMLLLLLFPGPVIMIEGRANLLKERAKLNQDPLFRTLAVLDFNAGTFVFGVDAHYRFEDSGRLIDLQGGAEAYFNINDPADWHFYLGQREPRDRRIRARIFQLFTAETYFMLDGSPAALAIGAGFGYSKSWKFGPLRVSAELWTEANVGVSLRPPHYSGGMLWHGGVSLSAFGVGLGLTVEVDVSAEVFDPFEIEGRFHVKLNLPWPLPDPGATVTLRWGPNVRWPDLPLPLEEVAIEHLKVGTSWSLPRGDGVLPALLQPNYDQGGGNRRPDDPSSPPFDDSMPPPAEAPVVPMDARPRLTFARRVHDDAMVGLNGRVHPEFERIGNPPDTGPVRVSYRLTEVRLEKWVDPTWQVVARKAADANPTGVEEIFGSWAPVPDLSGGDGTGDAGGHAQVKLWLWSANPFDYTRRVGRAWDEWFTDRFSDYPCLEPDAPKETCYDFETIPLSTPLDNGPSSFDPYLPSYRHPDNPLVEIIVDDAVLSGVPLVQILPQPVGGRTRGVCLGPLPDAVPNAPPPPTNSPVVDAIVSSRTEGSPIPSGVNALLSFLPTPNVGVRLLISPEATVLALDGSGNVFFAAAAPRAGDIAEILAPDLVLVAAYWNTNVCLSAVCVLTGHNAEQAARIGLVAQHNLDSVEHFEERGFVLDSHTNYRLVVATMLDAMGEGLLSDRFTPAYTEYAFFKTEGPPKLADLSIPLGQEAQEQIQLKDTQGNLIRNDGTINTGAPVLASELNDLGIYVRQTLPATIPANKERPDLPRPVYRAYDLGVEFNENYVQLMYRLDSRDLALFLFDQNNQPIRDTEGRLVVLRSGWDVAAEPIVDSSEMVWLTTLQLSTCAGTLSLQLQDDEQLRLPGITLDPDSVYEARLNPLLLHEDFNDDGLYQLADSASGTGAVLGRWTVEDQGGGAGTSTWVVQERGSPAQRIVTQTSNYFAGSLDGLVPDKPGTILRLNERAELAAGHVDQPSSWSDYRLSVFVRAADDDAIGVVFRRATATRYYRFSMDRERKYRRLTRHLDGVVTVLAEDEFVYQQDVDYEIVVEAIQDQLVIYQDGERIFSVTDASILQGTVGLYCWGLQVGSFADIRVDDFRETARSAFVYRFTTSRFSNFAHQIHSYQDETWAHPIDGVATSLLQPAVPSTQAPGPAEHCAWDAFEGTSALESLLRAPVDELQVVRLEEAGQPRALLLRSPEPIDVDRTTLELQQAPRSATMRGVPTDLKLVRVTRHATDAGQESVALIARQSLNPSGYAVEQLRIAPLLFIPDAGALLLDDQFDGRRRGLLFREVFGPNALDLYEIVDEGIADTSNWTVDAGTIFQSGNIFTGPVSADNLEKLGTMALRREPDWAEVKIRVVVESNDNDSIGLVFRYRDADNYYRFELNNQFNYRRLIKRVGGLVTVLWEDTTRGYDLSVDYEIEVVVSGALLVVSVNHSLQVVLEDTSLELGRAGLYCWGNDDTRFKEFEVTTSDQTPLLMSPPTSLSGLTVVDEGSADGPSDWQVTGGSSISQTSSIHTPSDATVAQLGTMLLGGVADWQDIRLSVRLNSSSGGAIGAVFRYVDSDNYYRFSMDSVGGYRRLVRRIDGAFVTLWEDNVGYATGQLHDLTVVAKGRQLRVWLDDVELLSIVDDNHQKGRVGLYTSNDGSAAFAAWTILDETVRLERWEIVDEGQVAGPSDWRIVDGTLSQRSNINDGVLDGAIPEKSGTMALAGNPTWDDLRVKINVRAEDDDALGIVFRYQDSRNYYRLSMDAMRSYRRLVKVTDGVLTVLWEDSNPYSVGVDFEVAVDAVGSRLRALHNGSELFSLVDEDHPQGRVGLYAWGHEDVRFNSVRVTRATLEVATLFMDHFDDGQISEWTFIDNGTFFSPSQWAVTGGSLQQSSNIFGGSTSATDPEKEGTYAVAGDTAWTDVVLSLRLSSGDDDAIGVMFRYTDNDNYYRFSMDQQRAYRRLVSKEGGGFRVIWEDAFQYEIDREYELVIAMRGEVIEAFLDGILMFRVRDAQHAAGSIALYSWANTDATFSDVRVYAAGVLSQQFALQDDFGTLRDGAYEFQDEGEIDGPSSWTVANGALLQTTAIRSADTLAATGSNAIRTELVAANFRVSASMSSSGGGAMGIVFRSSSQGYYRFAIDSDQQTRYLLKKVGSAFTVLFSEGFAVQQGTEYMLTVVCMNSQLTGFINGVQIFSVSDDSHSQGAVGLYVANNPNVAFGYLEVVIPEWLTYYRFGEEAAVPAGRRFRVISGSPTEPNIAEPLEAVRHVASSPLHESVLLTDGFTELRVVGPEGPSHRREFVPDSEFTPVAIRLLRRADGTSYVLIPDGGGSFAEGDYRCRLEYRRDGPGQVLSEAGETSSEVVQIDIPWRGTLT